MAAIAKTLNQSNYGIARFRGKEASGLTTREGLNLAGRTRPSKVLTLGR
jgi:hypothetical protein